MEDFYLLGMGVAFLIGFVKVCISVSTLCSMRARNLKKIGMYFSCSNGTFSGTKFSWPRFSFYLAFMLIIAPIFSWLSVASAAWGIIALITNRTPVPENMKIIQYKIARVDLSKEQLIDLQEDISRILGVSIPVITGDKDTDDDPYSLVLDKGDWYSKVQVDPKAMTLKFYSRTKDYTYKGHSKYEYRFEGDHLYVRLIEDWNDYFSKIDWNVRDGVVLESEIRKRNEVSSTKVRQVEKDLADYTSKTQWQPFNRNDIRYFVMAKHPTLFPHGELRRKVRSELERLRLVTQKVVTGAKSLGIEVQDVNDGVEFKYPEKFPEVNKIKAEQFFSSESLAAMGTSIDEVLISIKTQKVLMRILGES